MRFSRQELIRFRHCDPAEIVFYPRFLEMVVDTTEDWFEEMGLPFDEMKAKYNAGIPTVKLDLLFSSPAKLGDRLAIELYCKNIGNSSITVCIEAKKEKSKVFEANVVLCFTSIGEKVEKMNIPSDVKSALYHYLEPIEESTGWV